MAWNGWRDRVSRIKLQRMQHDHQIALRALDRKHEAELRDRDRQQEVVLRELDRQHEGRLLELGDLRALRDLKVERLRTNLVTLLDAALRLGDREIALRMNPARFTDPDPGLEQARTRLVDLRPVLLLDTESESLLRDVGELTRDDDTYLIALRHWQDQTEMTKASIAAGMGPPPVNGSMEAFGQVQERGDALAASIRKVIDSARAMLAEIERPIA